MTEMEGHAANLKSFLLAYKDSLTIQSQQATTLIRIRTMMELVEKGKKTDDDLRNLIKELTYES